MNMNELCSSSVPFCHRYHAISLLLSNDPALIDEILSEDRVRLHDDWIDGCADVDKSPEDLLLIGTALAIWTGRRAIYCLEELGALDNERLEAFHLAEDLLAGVAENCQCDYCISCMKSLISREIYIQNRALGPGQF